MSEMQARTADAVARVAAATAVAETLLAAVLAHGNGVTLRAWTESNLASGALLALGFATTAVFVVRHDTHNALGWLFLVMAHLHAATVLASEWAYRQLASGPPDGAVVTAAWVGSNAWWVALLLLAGLVPLLFPDGRLPSPRWRPVAAVAVTAIVVGAVAGVGSGALVVEAFPTVTVRAPLGSVPEALTTGVAVGGVLVALLCGVTGLVGIALRLRRADARERGRLSWFLVACLSLVLVEMLPPQPWSGLVANLLFPAALGVAIVRHGLYDGDRLLSRTLVYGLLTGAVLAALGLGAATVGRGVAGSSGGVVLAALVVALGLRPLHRLVQGAVDRALYGGRRDPYLALRSVSTHLSHQPDGGDPLEAVAQSVAQSLRAPRAEVLLDPDTGAQPDGAAAVDVPLTFGGRGVGTLRVHLRKGRTRLDPADVDLLADLTPQVAVAVRTTTLLEEARRSRERLLLAVEDEGAGSAATCTTGSAPRSRASRSACRRSPARRAAATCRAPPSSSAWSGRRGGAWTTSSRSSTDFGLQRSTAWG